MNADAPGAAAPGAAAPITDLIYGLDVRPQLRETLFVALQHVFAVFVGMISPPCSSREHSSCAVRIRRIW